MLKYEGEPIKHVDKVVNHLGKVAISSGVGLATCITTIVAVVSRDIDLAVGSTLATSVMLIENRRQSKKMKEAAKPLLEQSGDDR